MIEYNPNEIFKSNNGNLDSHHTVIFENSLDQENMDKQIRK
jgi:hypothetical protein